MQSQNDFYNQAIRSVSPYIDSIFSPSVVGTNCKIFFAKKYNSLTTFRFSNDDTVYRTHAISNILDSYGIPVPHTTVHSYNGVLFESYPFMGGQTFYERLISGMSDADINKVYHQIIDLIQQLSYIPTGAFNNVLRKNCDMVAEKNIVKKTNNKALGKCIKYGTQILNAGKQSVCHCDISPKNILLDKHYNVSGLLDLNAVSIGNVNFSVGLAGCNLNTMNLNPNIFYNIAQSALPDDINITRCQSLQRIFSFYFSHYIPRSK